MIEVGEHARTAAGAPRGAIRNSTAPATWVVVVAITAVAVLARAVFVGDQSLGYEEVFTLQIARQPGLSAVWHAVKSTESTPPLYYVLTWLWLKLAASQSATALRMTSLLAGVLTVPAAFLAVRRFMDTRLAVVAAWLCAISPVLVSYAIYARAYALLVLAATLSVWALGALLERPSWPRWLLWGLAVAVCLWTHYFAAFLVAGEVVVLFVKLQNARRALLVCLAAVAAATAPLWSLFLSQSDASERTSYIAAEPLGGRLEGVVRQFAMGTNVPAAWLEGAGIAVVGCAVLFAVLASHRQAPIRALAAVAVIGAGLPILSAITGIDDKLLARNLLGLWICVAALAAYGLVRLRGLPLVAYSVICITTVIAVQSNWRYQAAADWSGASARVEARAHGMPIAVEPGLELAVAGLYTHREPLSSPVATTNLWVIVQPVRGAGERALNPVANPPLAALWGDQFSPVAEIDYRGFRLIHLQSGSPVLVPPAPASNGSPAAPLALVLAP